MRMSARFLAFLLPVACHSYLSVLQWNPHFECFSSRYTKATCEETAFNHLSVQLAHVDFANVVELAGDYATPAGIGRITSKCGLDLTDLFFSQQHWKQGGTTRRGCLEGDDRPFVVQEFESTRGGPSVIVVGAHFPHGTEWSPLKNAISQVMQETRVEMVVLLADTNLNSGYTNERIMSNLGLPSNATSYVAGSSLSETTCCYPNFPAGFAFDRAIGFNIPDVVVQTRVELNSLPAYPSWAKSPRFHKSVHVVFNSPHLALASEGAERRPKANLRLTGRKRSTLQVDGDAADDLMFLQLPQEAEDELDELQQEL